MWRPRDGDDGETKRPDLAKEPTQIGEAVNRAVDRHREIAKEERRIVEGKWANVTSHPRTEFDNRAWLTEEAADLEDYVRRLSLVMWQDR